MSASVFRAGRRISPAATQAPGIVLIYESGTIGAKPHHLPLSIGDGELAETADAVVSVPEIFAYWLQGGRIDVGFLGAAQIDRFGNLNSTVIGAYDAPKVRLPGGGGAPEIAAACKRDLRHAAPVVARVRRAARFPLDRLRRRSRAGAARVHRPRVTVVVTDLGVLEPDSRRRADADRAPPRGRARRGAGRDRLGAACRRTRLGTGSPPTESELEALRAFKALGEENAA